MRHHRDAKSKDMSRSELMLLRKRFKTLPTRSVEDFTDSQSFPTFKSAFLAPTRPTDKVTLESLNERVTALERKFEASQFAESIAKLGDLLGSATLNKEQDSREKTARVTSSTSAQSVTESIVRRKKLQRCRFFPNCREGTRCAYFHPNRRCIKFPHCTFGSNCLFLHPFCPFGMQCRRANCFFMHYAAVGASDSEEEEEVLNEEDEEQEPVVVSPLQDRPGVSGIRPKTESFFLYRKELYPSYSSSSCTGVKSSASEVASPEQKTAYQTNLKVLKKCRYGARCLNRKCPFQHRSQS